MLLNQSKHCTFRSYGDGTAGHDDRGEYTCEIRNKHPVQTADLLLQTELAVCAAEFPTDRDPETNLRIMARETERAYRRALRSVRRDGLTGTLSTLDDTREAARNARQALRAWLAANESRYIIIAVHRNGTSWQSGNQGASHSYPLALAKRIAAKQERESCCGLKYTIRRVGRSSND